MNSYEKIKNIPLEKIIVFDVETTGLNPEIDDILQFSASDGSGKVLMNLYFKPERHSSWIEAEKINHITPDMVKDCPSIKGKLDEIQKIFDNAELYVTYNGQFDRAFLDVAGVTNILDIEDNKEFDVMLSLAEIYGQWSDQFQNYKWQKLVKAASYYGFDWNQYDAHNSMSDVIATLFVFNQIIGRDV